MTTSKTDQMLERLDTILEQLEQLGVPTLPARPETRLDAHGNPGLVAPGELIESAWGNAVVARTVYHFPNKAALDAATLPHGTMAIVLDSHVVYLRLGTAWIPTPVGNRVNFRGVGPAGGQSMGKNVISTAVWNPVSDPYGVLVGGSTFRVPPGWGGRYVFEWAVEWPDGDQAGSRLVFCDTNVGRLGQTSDKGQEGGTRLSGSGSAVLVAEQEAKISMYHTDPADILSVNAIANTYFQGYYAGPY